MLQENDVNRIGKKGAERFAVEIEGATKTHLICDSSLKIKPAAMVVWLGDGGRVMAHGRAQFATRRTREISIRLDGGKLVSAPQDSVICAVGVYRDI